MSKRTYFDMRREVYNRLRDLPIVQLERSCAIERLNFDVEAVHRYIREEVERWASHGIPGVGTGRDVGSGAPECFLTGLREQLAPPLEVDYSTVEGDTLEEIWQKMDELGISRD